MSISVEGVHTDTTFVVNRITLVALIAATAFAGGVLWSEVAWELAPYEAGLPWWALAAGFAAAHRFPLRIRGQAVTLWALPLVLGLVLATPGSLLLAMAGGPGAVMLLRREWAPMTLARLVLTGGLAVVVAHAVAAAPAPIGPQVWAGVLAAVLAGIAVTAVLDLCVGGMAGKPLRRRAAAMALAVEAAVAIPLTSAALAAATIASAEPLAAALLLLPAAALVLAYRTYASQRSRQETLEFLYGVAQSLSRGRELDSELLDLLRRARASLRVRTAELVLLPAGRDLAAMRTSLAADGGEEVMAPIAHAPAAALRGAVDHERAVLVERAACEPELRRYLGERGIGQALLAPVRGETRLTGVIVLGDRVGGTFAHEDLELLESLAHHAGLSLEFDRLEREAQSDPLTGLANRSLFLDRVKASLARPEGTVTVLFLDLDDFKGINDSTGHAAGDAVLVAVARRVEAALRPNDLAARMGGDEFAVLLEDVDEEHALRVAGRVVDLLSNAVVVDGSEVSVRSSVGIGSVAAGSAEAAELLRQADAAMYRAKEAGKGQVRVWCPEMQPSPAGEGAGGDAATRRDELAAALEGGELVAHFQPVVALATGETVAVEALARWRHPRHGLLGPASFVPMAEGHGLVAEIDREVLWQACTAAASGVVPAVHVNLAAVVADTIEEVLLLTGLDPAKLVLELTERALYDAPTAELQRLRRIGVRIAFDNFGTGPQALEILREHPLDLVKVARPLVDGARRGAHDRALLSMVMQVAAMFGTDVIAEGVERDDQRAALLELGCELGQGHLLGRPLPLGAVGVA